MADGLVLPPQPQAEVQPNDGRPMANLGEAPPRPTIYNWQQLRQGSGEPPNVVIEDHRPDGTVTQVLDDGSVNVGMPAVHTHRGDEDDDFDRNLALDNTINLTGIGTETVEGVRADQASRSEWESQYEKALGLLGLKIEELEAMGRARTREPSRANHTLLIEAIVKYFAGASAELLPASGPAKVATIGRQPDEEEMRAKDFQDTLNYYLTDVATEYYDDTPRMLIHQAFCGQGYKKAFRCPVRRRPVSESVNAEDLIVSEQAVNLDNAIRVTHQIQMTKADLFRMQIAGAYADVKLPTPTQNFGLGGMAQRKIKETEGITLGGSRPQDMNYLVWETDEDLDLGQNNLNGKYERAVPDGMPLPYKVVTDVTGMHVLAVRRNWRRDDPFFRKRNMFVKFGLIPGMGFYDWGFMQLLGNQTRNLRTMLRLLISAGMFNLFPGGFKLKGARTSSNEGTPGVGEWVDVDFTMGPGVDISKLFMPMPYKPADPTYIQLMELHKQDAMRLGGTVELEVGEGRTNVPVGTVLAMVEQQVQVMAAVHKGNHRAQKSELRKIRELFAENPKDLWVLTRERPKASDYTARMWETADEFMDLNLTPATDPNVPSQAHRLMSANVALMVSGMPQAQGKVDIEEVLRLVFNAIGLPAERYVIRAEQQPQPGPDPKVAAKQAELEQKQQEDLQKAQQGAAELQLKREQMAADLQKAAAGNETSLQVEALKAHAQHAAQEGALPTANEPTIVAP